MLSGVAAVFLDDGGVLNDNRRRAPAWQRLTGAFFSARFGGAPARWAAANARAFPAAWAAVGARGADYPSHRAHAAAYSRAWIAAMEQAAGIALGLTDAEAQRTAEACAVFVAERADAAIPGAADAVRAMRRAGLRLHMASGTPSAELHAILSRMGIRDQLGALCGPDLIDLPKAGPAYYAAVLAHTGEAAETSLVIESSPRACAWARAAGLRAVCCDIEGGSRLAELL